MITTTKTKRLDLPTSSQINKQILIKMAKSGEDKPHYSSKLYHTLSSYIQKSNRAYDPIFSKTIKKLRPDWFVDRSKKANENKQKLIKMAKSGKPRPKYGHSMLGRLLSSYTIKSSSYDSVFTKHIKRLRPDWFISTAESNKKKLIELAKKGKQKPKQKTKLGQALHTYINKNRNTYDANFVNIIKRLNKSWIILSNDENKKILIKLAKKGAPRPKQKTKLGSCLCCYTNRNTDPEFTRKIKKLRPDWFVLNTDVSKAKKQKLINFAKSGKPRPKIGTVLGNALVLYTSTRDGDKNFKRLIKKTRPDWFVKSSDIKKQMLIQMAKSGQDKPNRKNNFPLLHSLNNYTIKSSKVYDSIFDKNIRNLRPDWFRKI